MNNSTAMPVCPIRHNNEDYVRLRPMDVDTRNEESGQWRIVKSMEDPSRLRVSRVPASRSYVKTVEQEHMDLDIYNEDSGTETTDELPDDPVDVEMGECNETMSTTLIIRAIVHPCPVVQPEDGKTSAKVFKKDIPYRPRPKKRRSRFNPYIRFRPHTSPKKLDLESSEEE